MRPQNLSQTRILKSLTKKNFLFRGSKATKHCGKSGPSLTTPKNKLRLTYKRKDLKKGECSGGYLCFLRVLGGTFGTPAFVGLSWERHATSHTYSWIPEVTMEGWGSRFGGPFPPPPPVWSCWRVYRSFCSGLSASWLASKRFFYCYKYIIIHKKKIQDDHKP